MPRRPVSRVDPEIRPVFQKFRQRGKSPKDSLNLARRFVGLQEVKTKTPFNSAEALALIKMGFFGNETSQPPLIFNQKRGPVVTVGPVQRAINELKRNDINTQRQIITVAVREIISHPTVAGMLMKPVRGTNDMRQLIDQMIEGMTRRKLNKTVSEIAHQRYLDFDSKPKPLQERLLQETRANLRGEIGLIVMQQSIDGWLDLSQREVQMMNQIGPQSYFSARDAPHKVSPKAAEEWAKWTIRTLNHLRFLQNAFANPKNAAHAKREIAKLWA